jgi:hypothetical protein
VIQVNGLNEATTYVSPTQITALMPASQLTSGAVLKVTVIDGGAAAGADSSLTLTVDNPSPVLIAISPSNLVSGSSDTVLNLSGTGFLSSSTVQVNGTSHLATYVSSTQINIALSAVELATAGSFSVVVTNSAPGGGSSSAASYAVNNPAPLVTGLTPSTFTVGAAATTLAISGAGFLPSTTVQINGVLRSASYVNSTQINIQLSATDLATTGNFNVALTNPAPGGGLSSTVFYSVNNPAPVIKTFDPASVTAGGSTLKTIAVNGNGFVPSTVIQVNEVAHTTTYQGTSQVTFQLSLAEQAVETNLLVKAVNPAPGGGASGANILPVGTSGSPHISSISPTQAIVNTATVNFTVSGTGFSSSCSVLWNGTPLPTGYLASSGVLFTTARANLLTAVGTVNVSVRCTNSAADSNAVQFNITNPPPPIANSVSTSIVPIRTSSSITVYGAYFTPSTTAQIDGVTMPGTYSSGILTVNLPATAITTPGLKRLTFTSEWGTSAATTLTAYVPIVNNNMIYNPTNGLFYLSVPSAAGAPYGNSIVSVDASTGNVGTPIPVGSEPDRMTISSDGRYLWVALDGASAIRKIDLTTGIVSPPFLYAPAGNGSLTVSAMIALPGESDSIAITTYDGNYSPSVGAQVAIFDGGVPRSNAVTTDMFDTFPWVLLLDQTKKEIYGPGGYDSITAYRVYSYDADGVMLKTTLSNSPILIANNSDDMVLAAGHLYSSIGKIFDVETGALLSTLNLPDGSPARGSIALDATLGREFILNDSTYADAFNDGPVSGVAARLFAYNLSDNSLISPTPVQVSIPVYRASYRYAGQSGARLTRWGSDGLAFRGTGGFVSLRSGAIRDLTAVNADLSVSITPDNVPTTGAVTTYTTVVRNDGPSTSTSVVLSGKNPSTGVLSSVISSVGFCAGTQIFTCNLGDIASGSSVTVSIKILQTTAGTGSTTVQVSASESDPTINNNQSVSTLTVTGGNYSLEPAIASVAPAIIASGASDTTITVKGASFSEAATVMLDGSPLVTSFVDAETLNASVPSNNLSQMGWAAITVKNPAPGGGTSTALPLTVFSTLDLGANRIVYDPYTRKLMATVGAGSPSTAANSIVAITPETTSTGAPVATGRTPTRLALTDDGEVLYALLPSSTSAGILRFNMRTQAIDFAINGLQTDGYEMGLRDVAALPGSHDTVAVDMGDHVGVAMYDFDPVSHTAAKRPSAVTFYAGTCLVFKDANTLFMTNVLGGAQALGMIPVTSSGLIDSSNGAVLGPFSCNKKDGGQLYSQGGGVADITGPMPRLKGIFYGPPNLGYYAAGVTDMAGDTSQGLAYYLISSTNQYSTAFDQLAVVDTKTFLPLSVLPLPFSAIEGATASGVDVVRWGQDGLAILTGKGRVYLMHGGLITPQLLTTASAAALTGSSATTIAAGSANTLLTLTGSNFVPGVAVTWNGSYRTTTIVDASHITVAVPSSDLATTNTATLVATNPGASASNSISIAVQ